MIYIVISPVCYVYCPWDFFCYAFCPPNGVDMLRNQRPPSGVDMYVTLLRVLSTQWGGHVTYSVHPVGWTVKVTVKTSVKI